MVNRECATPPYVQVCHTMWLSFTKPSPALVLQATNAGARRPGYVATITPHTHTNQREIWRIIEAAEDSCKDLHQGWSTASLTFRIQNPIHPLLWMDVTTPGVRLCLCGDVVMVADGEEGDTCSSSINNRSSHSYCTQQTALIHVANSVLLSCEENWPLFNS